MIIYKKKIKNKILKIKSNKIIILNNKIYYKNKYINKNIKIKKINNRNIINILIFKNIINKLPIHIIIIYNKKYNKKNKYLNINIIIKKNIYLYIIKEFYSYSKIKYINFNINIKIKKKSNLFYILIINLNKKINIYIKQFIKILKRSKLNKFIFFIESKKINIKNKILLYEKSLINIKSVSLIKKNNNFINNIKILHKFPNSKSFQKHKNILLQSGLIKTNTKIIILKKSYNSNAIFENNNLLFCNPNMLYSKPQLNILNKKSKCIHKVTINNINKNIIFYLSTRGFNNNKIKKILYIIFIYEIIKKIKIKELKKKIYKLLIKIYK